VSAVRIGRLQEPHPHATSHTYTMHS